MLRLNLGCSDDVRPGWLNVDLSPECVPLPHTEVAFADLRKPWPWKTSSVAEIRAWDIIEHLPDMIHTMNEAWRVLQPNGRFEIEVPTTDGPGAFQDPTHVSFWNRNSFFYYTDGDPHRIRFGKSYGIEARFAVADEELKVPGGVPKLWIVLEAIKL